MLKGKWDIFDKLNSHKIIVGYDLGDRFSQISYCHAKGEEPQTVSVVAGEENYNIPTVLCKRKNVNQWYYGKEALKYAKEEGAQLIDNLVSRALTGEEIEIEETFFQPTALLTLFIKRSLGLLSLTAGADQIGALMITCRELPPEMVEVLETAAAGLMLKTECICIQSYVESIYYYMLYQPEELWKNQVAVYDYADEKLFLYRMECNRRTTPIVTFIQREEHGMETFGTVSDEKKDERLLQIAEKLCAEHTISTSYLVGEGFQEEWMQKSLKFLCRNKRLFKGNNLYSKGACHAMREKLSASETGKQYVFLGEEKLKANIGMQVLKQGETSYYALLDAGINWYEAQKECEFLLESGNSFEIKVTPLNGKGARLVTILLDGFPKRPAAASRLHMKLQMKDVKSIQVTIQDLGFGEIFPAGQTVWTQEILIN